MLNSIFEQHLFFTSYDDTFSYRQVSDQQERFLFYEELDGQNCLVGHHFFRSDNLVLIGFIIVLLFKIIDVEFYDIFVMVVIQERQLFLLVEPVLSFLSCLFIGQTDKLAILLFYVLRFDLRELLVRSLLAAPLHLSAANGSNRLVHDRAWWVISVLRRLEPTETICWFLLKLVYFIKKKLNYNHMISGLRREFKIFKTFLTVIIIIKYFEFLKFTGRFTK